jgi:hypothetical protein
MLQFLNRISLNIPWAFELCYQKPHRDAGHAQSIHNGKVISFGTVFLHFVCFSMFFSNQHYA